MLVKATKKDISEFQSYTIRTLSESYQPLPTLSSTSCLVGKKILLAIVNSFSTFCVSLSYFQGADLENFTLAVWKLFYWIRQVLAGCSTRTRDFAKVLSKFSFFTGRKRWGGFLPVCTTSWRACGSKLWQYRFSWTSSPNPTKMSRRISPLYSSPWEVASSNGSWDGVSFVACHVNVAVLNCTLFLTLTLRVPMSSIHVLDTWITFWVPRASILDNRYHLIQERFSFFV